MHYRHMSLFILGLTALLLAACTAATPATPTATLAPTRVATPAPPTAQPETAAVAIPQGKTPEGYDYLGDPNAPVTLEEYSDFF